MTTIDCMSYIDSIKPADIIVKRDGRTVDERIFSHKK